MSNKWQLDLTIHLGKKFIQTQIFNDYLQICQERIHNKTKYI